MGISMSQMKPYGKKNKRKLQRFYNHQTLELTLEEIIIHITKHKIPY